MLRLLRQARVAGRGVAGLGSLGGRGYTTRADGGMLRLLRQARVALCGRGYTTRSVKLRNLPFDITEATLTAKLNDLGVTPNSVELGTRANGRFTGIARAMFDNDETATVALRKLRKTPDEAFGRKLLVGLSQAHASGQEKDPKIMAEIVREDPLQEILNHVEERRMPTLEEVRAQLIENDKWDYLRTLKLPGLTSPDWDNDEPTAYRSEAPAVQVEHEEVIGKWAETIVKVDRVQKVVRGGTIMKYRALVVVGNLMGAGGFAYGKGALPADAVSRASKKAKRNLFFSERYKGCALTHDVRGKHNSCIVDILSVPPGYGNFGGALGRAILTQMGFSAFTIKGRGRRSPASFVYATFDALRKMQSVADVARKRGRRILEVEQALAEGVGKNRESRVGV